jgi:hypothetical protein
MSSNKVFKFAKACTQRGYISEFCENIFRDNNFEEEPAFKNMPKRMAYEPEIWIVGSSIMQELKKLKGKKIDYSLLLEDILIVIKTKKYNSGRQSFVMTLHYFKNNCTVEELLISLLDDEQLYGFAIKELMKLKLYCCIDKVSEILKTEKMAWIKKEAELYIKNSHLNNNVSN